MKQTIKSDYTDLELRQLMIDWLSDCQWQDVEPEDFEDMSNAELKRGIERHFCGGMEEFKKATQL